MQLSEKRITLVQEMMVKAGIDVLLVPTQDEFQGEYTPACAQRLAWATGFTGSAGNAFISGPALKETTHLFVDGRYTIQAQQQCGGFAQIHNIADARPIGWLIDQAQQAGAPLVIGIDPKLHTVAAYEQWQKQIDDHAGDMPLEIRLLMHNLIDAAWEDRPAEPNQPMSVQALDYAGKAHGEKIADVCAELKKKRCDAVFITNPDSICWLLNIRGNDVPYNPLVLSYALVASDGAVMVFLNDTNQPGEDVREHVGDQVSFHPIDRIGELLTMVMHDKRVMIDPRSCSIYLDQCLVQAGAELVKANDPCILPKAIKNEAEIAGMRAAHDRDGVALRKFLQWFDEQVEARGSVDELQAEEVLEGFRAEDPHYLGPSFATIAGAGEHGAIVHYRAVEETNRKLLPGELLLVDSGGQYRDGTTDVTRTMVYGNPSDEAIDRYTRVLKGHIALAMAQFPEGTSGAQLDALARQFLWQVGLDYDHGTGHGVGAYLCVHEGPQGISKRYTDVALQPGMILSNEPGYYKAGEYGIRIENLVLVVEKGVGESGKKMLGFDTLTKAPLCEKLIDRSMMSEAETQWLDTYQASLSRHTAT